MWAASIKETEAVYTHHNDLFSRFIFFTKISFSKKRKVFFITIYELSQLWLIDSESVVGTLNFTDIIKDN